MRGKESERSERRIPFLLYTVFFCPVLGLKFLFCLSLSSFVPSLSVFFLIYSLSGRDLFFQGKICEYLLYPVQKFLSQEFFILVLSSSSFQSHNFTSFFVLLSSSFPLFFSSYLFLLNPLRLFKILSSLSWIKRCYMIWEREKVFQKVVNFSRNLEHFSVNCSITMIDKKSTVIAIRSKSYFQYKKEKNLGKYWQMLKLCHFSFAWMENYFSNGTLEANFNIFTISGQPKVKGHDSQFQIQGHTVK